MTRKPKIHDLFATPRSGQMIEALSFETIDCFRRVTGRHPPKKLPLTL